MDIDITKISDLDLAQILVDQMNLLMQVQSNLLALRAELQRRKEAVKPEEVK